MEMRGQSFALAISRYKKEAQAFIRWKPTTALNMAEKKEMPTPAQNRSSFFNLR
jgi:hypothetical protein